MAYFSALLGHSSSLREAGSWSRNPGRDHGGTLLPGFLSRSFLGFLTHPRIMAQGCCCWALPSYIN